MTRILVDDDDLEVGRAHAAERAMLIARVVARCAVMGLATAGMVMLMVATMRTPLVGLMVAMGVVMLVAAATVLMMTLVVREVRSVMLVSAVNVEAGGENSGEACAGGAYEQGGDGGGNAAVNGRVALVVVRVVMTAMMKARPVSMQSMLTMSGTAGGFVGEAVMATR